LYWTEEERGEGQNKGELKKGEKKERQNEREQDTHSNKVPPPPNQVLHAQNAQNFKKKKEEGGLNFPPPHPTFPHTLKLSYSSITPNAPISTPIFPLEGGGRRERERASRRENEREGACMQKAKGRKEGFIYACNTHTQHTTL
jgi:hypothetical protein